jgi:general secretion pathway protein C
LTSARIASLIRGNAWLPNLLFVALSAFFIAGSINAVVAKAIRPIPSLEDAPPPPVPSAARLPQHVPLVALAERNLFGVKRESLTPAGEASGPQEPAYDLTVKDFKESDLQPCTVNALLRATLVADRPEWSMAIVVKNDTREPAAYSINAGSNAVADDAIIVAIRSREIVVRRRDHFERCSGEGDTANGSPPPMAQAQPTPMGDEPASPTPGDMSGVTKLSATDFRVERAEVDRSLTNLNEVATQARIVPSFRNGKANGFKLFSIKPGSIYSKIGLQNGDVIQKINGYDMNSPDRALEIYTKLRDATSLTIELMRGGNVQTMNYAITG